MSFRPTVLRPLTSKPGITKDEFIERVINSFLAQWQIARHDTATSFLKPASELVLHDRGSDQLDSLIDQLSAVIDEILTPLTSKGAKQLFKKDDDKIDADLDVVIDFLQHLIEEGYIPTSNSLNKEGVRKMIISAIELNALKEFGFNILDERETGSPSR